MPMMAFSGVRSSWLTTDTKRRLAWLAASARASASNMRFTSVSTYRLSATIPSASPTPAPKLCFQNSLVARTVTNPPRLSPSEISR